MYEFEAAYHYGPTERYNAGRGLQMMSDDLPRLRSMLEVRKNEPESYALRIRDMSSSEVICEHGSIEAANASMIAAYYRRARGE